MPPDPVVSRVVGVADASPYIDAVMLSATPPVLNQVHFGAADVDPWVPAHSKDSPVSAGSVRLERFCWVSVKLSTPLQVRFSL